MILKRVLNAMIDQRLISYIESIQPTRSDIYKQLEEIADNDKIPIIVPETGYFLQLICTILKPKRILEIGTAIGYSALWLCDNTEAIIDTIEINSERIEQAKKLFLSLNKIDRINFHLGDAIDILPTFIGMNEYDLVFIDAAKGQYHKYFEQIEKITNKGAIVITDNVFFHGMVPGIEEPSKRLKPIVDKIDGYNQMLHNNDRWATSFYTVGDGIAVSIKKD
jgi:predicted O-methyltransferase YrrM